MTEFSTPFFFGHWNVNEPGNKVAIIQHDPYRLFCLRHEIAYWLRYNTVHFNGLLALAHNLPPLPRPRVVVSLDCKDRESLGNNADKSYATIRINPMCNQDVELAIKNLIEDKAIKYQISPCLIVDSNISLFDDLGQIIPQQFIAEALTTITCQPSLSDTSIAYSKSSAQPIEHYTITDKYTTRLYAMIDAPGRMEYDDRAFDELYTTILIESIDQIKVMWKNGFVTNAGQLVDKWPLVEQPQPLSNTDDSDTVWYCHSYPADTSVVDRFMTPLALFYQSRLQGNNVIRCKIPRNYPIFYHIARQLSLAGYSFRFIHNYLEVVVSNFKQCLEVNSIVDSGLLAKDKVVLYSHPQMEQLASDPDVTFANVDYQYYALIPVPAHIISSDLIMQLNDQLDHIVVPYSKV